MGTTPSSACESLSDLGLEYVEPLFWLLLGVNDASGHLLVLWPQHVVDSAGHFVPGWVGDALLPQVNAGLLFVGVPDQHLLVQVEVLMQGLGGGGEVVVLVLA